MDEIESVISFDPSEMIRVTRRPYSKVAYDNNSSFSRMLYGFKSFGAFQREFQIALTKPLDQFALSTKSTKTPIPYQPEHPSFPFHRDCSRAGNQN